MWGERALPHRVSAAEQEGDPAIKMSRKAAAAENRVVRRGPYNNEQMPGIE